MIDHLLDLLAGQIGNDFFSGGLALGLMGGLAAFVARLVPFARRFAAARLLTAVTVSNRDPLFGYLLAWLNAHPYSRRCRNVAASIPPDKRASGIRGAVRLVPGTGGHLLFLSGVPVWLERKAGDGPEPGDLLGRSEPRELIRLTAVGRRQSFLRDLLMEVAARFGERDPTETLVYRDDSFEDWTEAARIRRRGLDSVVFPAGIAERIVADARAFLGNANWYVARGIPWRRGYLLHGVPGTGKTSLIRAIAGELDLDIAMVSISSGRVDDMALARLLLAAPANAILVIEDVDAIFSERDAGDGAGKVTFSGLLNAIDGVMAQEGHLLFMTTNHIERLDAALIRPGRIDITLEAKVLDEDCARRMFLRFFPGEDEMAAPIAAEFAGRSPAEVQAHLLLLSANLKEPTDLPEDDLSSVHDRQINPSKRNELVMPNYDCS